MNLSVCFEEALRYAVIIHAGQMRKGTGLCGITERSSGLIMLREPGN
jgi:hypothetical protein